MPDPGTMTGNRSTFLSPLVSILENWYSKLLVKLRWDSCFLYCFTVASGVRQESVYHPPLTYSLILLLYNCINLIYDVTSTRYLLAACYTHLQPIAL
jgi:hypothetical protein